MLGKIKLLSLSGFHKWKSGLYSASCCSWVNATTGFNEQINLLMSPLDSDMAEFLLQLFAMGGCQELGLTVLTAIGSHMLRTSRLWWFSTAAVVPTYSFCLFWSGEMHFEMIWELGQMLGKWKFYFCQEQSLVLIRKKGTLASLGQFGQDIHVRDIMLLPPISFLFTPQLLGHMLLSPCSVLAWQTKGSDVPCEWSRKWSKRMGFKLWQTWLACTELTSSPDCLIWQKTGTLSWIWSLLLWPHVVLISNTIISGFCAFTRVCVGK